MFELTSQVSLHSSSHSALQSQLSSQRAEFDIELEAVRVEAAMYSDTAARLREEVDGLRFQFQVSIQEANDREAATREHLQRDIDRLSLMLQQEQSKLQEADRSRMFLSERYTQVATGGRPAGRSVGEYEGCGGVLVVREGA